MGFRFPMEFLSLVCLTPTDQNGENYIEETLFCLDHFTIVLLQQEAIY